MNAVEPSVELFRNICESAEARIAAHFERVDALEDKSQIDNLKLAALAEDIAKSLRVKQRECVYSVSIYLRNRPDLELRAGSNGGICRIGDKSQKIPMTPKECALKHYDAVKECSFTVINDAFIKAREEIAREGLNKKPKLKIETLCDVIAAHLNLKDYAVYHCFKSYIEEERADLEIVLGRYGGLIERNV